MMGQASPKGEEAGASYAPIRDTVKGKRLLKFFAAQGVDELVAISLAMAQELWAVKARLAAVEKVADRHGLPPGRGSGKARVGRKRSATAGGAASGLH